MTAFNNLKIKNYSFWEGLKARIFGLRVEGVSENTHVVGYQYGGKFYMTKLEIKESIK
jgi:hypothetical protein